jgi:hypothetical protein
MWSCAEGFTQCTRTPAPETLVITIHGQCTTYDLQTSCDFLKSHSCAVATAEIMALHRWDDWSPERAEVYSRSHSRAKFKCP